MLDPEKEAPNKAEDILSALASTDLSEFFSSTGPLAQVLEGYELRHSQLQMAEAVKRAILEVFPPGTVTEFYGASEGGFTRITAEEWLAEIDRLTHDPATGRPFAPGDLVEVRARAPGLFFNGKTNVNEVHRKTPATDFDIVLLQAGFGRSMTEVPLSFVKDAADQFIFDPQRLTGCEWLQGTLVRFRGVTFVSTSGWAPNATLTVQDATGRTFPVRLGRGGGLAACGAPAGPVTLVGIFDQEDNTSADGWMGGYRLWVPDYAGYVIPAALELPGDLNCDGLVNFDDIDPFVLSLGDAEGYHAAYPCCRHENADCNGDGAVDFDDIDAFVAVLGS